MQLHKRTFKNKKTSDLKMVFSFIALLFFRFCISDSSILFCDMSNVIDVDSYSSKVIVRQTWIRLSGQVI